MVEKIAICRKCFVQKRKEKTLIYSEEFMFLTFEVAGFCSKME
jgi:hypothetical protein